MNGRSIEMYLVDGHPEGMVTAEVFNWTGHVLVFPRTQIAQALARPESKRTGVYLLLGEKGGTAYAYVGESEDIPGRFKSHEAAKDWWTLAALITTAGNSLSKAHVRYLEGRLVEEAKAAGSSLDNGISPSKGTLNESGIANMEAFLTTLLMLLPTLRIDVFNKPAAVKTAKAGPTTPTFVLQTLKTGVDATAIWLDGALVVRKGSLGQKWNGVGSSYVDLQSKLIASGVLSVSGEKIQFEADHPFSSPSAAAAVLNGRSTNGQFEWKLKGSGQTYREWEQSQVAKEAAE